MRRELIVLLASALMLPSLSGCLWLTGTVAAIVGTNDSSGNHSAPDPVVIPKPSSRGALLRLEGYPYDLLVADLIPDDGNQNVPVLSKRTASSPPSEANDSPWLRRSSR
jgi:hypothetical protein